MDVLNVTIMSFTIDVNECFEIIFPYIQNVVYNLLKHCTNLIHCIFITFRYDIYSCIYGKIGVLVFCVLVNSNEFSF